ncbi:MAG: PDZ domain-containing protein [Candidatus Cloacimonadota bacterium]|nr:MAG: PDZ domain-containing protein [Candidatus Cloacimonadota bacterium]
MNKKELLKGVRNALAEKGFFKRFTSIYIESQIHIGGLKGALKEWHSLPNQSRTDTDLGVIKQTSGFNGRIEWTVDTNGQLQRGDRNAIKMALTSAVVDNYRYLTPDKDIIVGIAGEDEKYYILDVRHRRGSKQEIYINKKSFLPVTHKFHHYNLTIVTSYKEFRKKEGLKFPRKQIQEIVEQKQLTEINVKKVEINRPEAQTIFSPPDVKVKDYRFDKWNRTSLPFELYENHIYLKGSLNGKSSFDFLLDTGAGMNVIDKKFARKIGLKPKGKLKAQGVGGSTDFAIVEFASLKLKGLRMEKQTAIVIDIQKKIEKFTGRGCDVILGYDFLSRFATKIDYQKKRITFYRPGHFKYRKDWQFIDATYTTVPTIKATVEGKYRGYFRIDTGSGSFVDFHEPFVKEKKLTRGRKRIIEAEGIGAGGSTKILLTRIKEFKIGSTAIKNPLVGMAQNAKGAFGSKEVSGNIGNRLLKKFIVVFDYKGSKFGFKKTRLFNRKAKLDRSGLLLIKDKNKIKIRTVLPFTPGDKAGFRKGDELLEVDGDDAKKIGIHNIKMTLRGRKGKIITIKIKRWGKGKIIKLKLETYI